MKRLKNILGKVWLLPVAAMLLLVSCDDKEFDATFNPSRAFTPANLKITNGETKARIEWDASLFSETKPMKYTIQASRTNTFATIDYTAVVDTAAADISDANVAIKTDYFVRVRANALNGSGESNWLTGTTAFRILGEQILLAPLATEITGSAITLRWKPTPGLTRITLTPTSGNAVNVTLTATDVTAANKLVTGLAGSTTYAAEIFAGNVSKGTVTFTTRAPLPTGPNVVTLGATDDLATMIQSAASGTIFVLLKNTKYTTDNLVNLPAGASITLYGEDAPTKPVLAFNGFNLPATSGTIRFENLDITGYQDNDPAKAKRNYIFNQSTANTTTEINFENCIIRNLVNTPMRIQSANAITIGRFVMNRCVVYDIGDNGANGAYAVVHSNVATGKINNIVLTNSTFYRIGYGLVLHNAAPSQSVMIDNNTFYNVTGDARYFIDYNAQVISGAFTFNNNVVGKTYSPLGTARGIRAGSTPAVAASYKTNDVVYASNPITGIIDYANTSANLFTDPANGIFTFKDAAFAGKGSSGDPRWR